MQETPEQTQEKHEVYPLTFRPAFKDYPWGGRNLAEVLGRDIPDGIVAESWDIAAHENGSSIVRDGPESGLSLPQVLEKWGRALVGARNQVSLDLGKFPLLVKILDANSWLSVQVHPADDYALEHEGEYGKTEMWVVLRAEPDAELIYGFRTGVTKEAFQTAIEEANTADWLYRLRVEEGDVVFVPAGTVHALGPGVMVAEIQQNSDTTYRIYDWGRPRPLHIDRALDVLDFSIVEPDAVIPVSIAGGEAANDGVERELIGECPYFRTERLRLRAGQRFEGMCDGSTFEIWGVLTGSMSVTGDFASVPLEAVDWVLLPAALGRFSVEATEEDDDTVLLRVYTPEPTEGR